MRVLIVAAAVLACAAAVPSGALLAGSYAHGLAGSYAHGLAGSYAHGLASPYANGLVGHGLAVGHAASYAVAPAPLAVAHAAPAIPTISPGDIQGAAIDAHVEASDHVRAASDAAREYHDQAAELQGRAVNAAVDHSWQAVDAVKTAEAQLDGAAAGVAPVLAKQLVGHSPVAAYAAAPAAYAAPVLAGHAAYAAGPVLAGHAAYAAGPAYGASAYGASKTVVTQSLSQSHPAPVVHAPVYSHAPVAYAAHGAHGFAHGW